MSYLAIDVLFQNEISVCQSGMSMYISSYYLKLNKIKKEFLIFFFKLFENVFFTSFFNLFFFSFFLWTIPSFVCHLFLTFEHRSFSRSFPHYGLIPFCRRISCEIQLLLSICINKSVLIHFSQLHFCNTFFIGLGKSVLSFNPKFILKAIFYPCSFNHASFLTELALPPQYLMLRSFIKKVVQFPFPLNTALFAKNINSVKCIFRQK